MCRSPGSPGWRPCGRWRSPGPRTSPCPTRTRRRPGPGSGAARSRSAPSPSRPAGRPSLADRDGASFGIWEGALFTDWETWRKPAPAFIHLHTRDAFDAAIFYGEVLEWATERPGCCEVRYEGNEVVLRSEGEIVARISSGALEAAPDPTIRPHWQVHFSVSDVAARVEAAQHHGGTILTHDANEAVLRDPDGAQFTITSRSAR